MTVFGITMVKNESDIIAASVLHMLNQVDEVLVLDNGSYDGTREILEELPVWVLDDPEPAYYQAIRITKLANIARERHADWVVPFDADEIWKTTRGGTIADVLADVPSHVGAVGATLFDHVVTNRDVAEERDPTKRIRWRRRYPGELPKVACRTHPRLEIDQGNHRATVNGWWTPMDPLCGLLEVRHFSYRSARQFINKVRHGAAAYAATNLPEDVGAHWRQYGRILDTEGETGLRRIFEKHFSSVDPEADDLVEDPAAE